MLNIKSQSLLDMDIINNEDEKNIIRIGNENNEDINYKEDNDKNLKLKHKYTKI